LTLQQYLWYQRRIILFHTDLDPMLLFFRRLFWHSIVFSFLPGSALWANFHLFDEVRLSFGVGQHDFRDYRLDLEQSPDFIAQHYNASSPILQLFCDKEFATRWHTRWLLDAHYDFSIEAENTVNNGKYVFNGHSLNAELKSLILFNTDRQRGVTLGVGVGLGCFAIKTYYSPLYPTTYDPYPHLMAPIFHIEKNHSFLGVPGCFSAEISRLDFYYFQGIGYQCENILWLQKTPQVDQGLRIQYVYWNLDQGKRRGSRWMSDLHGIRLTLDLRFK